MIEWVLDTYYSHLFNTQDYVESSILVMDAGESQLIDLMNHILAKYPALKLFSLPKLDHRRTTELGVKGASGVVNTALDEIKTSVTALGFPWSEL
jgi:molybdopterin-biosynthesis enzyme MoeA-like protein